MTCGSVNMLPVFACKSIYDETQGAGSHSNSFKDLGIKIALVGIIREYMQDVVLDETACMDLV